MKNTGVVCSPVVGSVAFPRCSRPALFLRILLLLFLVTLPHLALANDQASAGPAPRILQHVDDTNLVLLRGNTHPLAVAQYDRGAVPDAFPIGHMFLQLSRAPQQEEALQSLLTELQNPRSPNYHHWLSAEELGRDFGPAQQDIDAVVEWLNLHGFQVHEVYKAGLTIDLSGTAGQVRDAFHTEIHRYAVNGREHIANSSDPSIPAALASVVTGIVSLHDFLPKPLVTKPRKAFTFTFEGLTLYFESPADFATIYNVSPLYKSQQPITGKGQSVVVLEDSDMNPADYATFRSAFGLSSYSGKFAQIHPGPGCADPGTTADEIEAAIDSEWAGAVAPDADVNLASCADTTTNFGGFIAAQNLLDSKTPPPIMSLSYLSCEAALGPAGNAFVAALWQQAALEGTSAFVAAGDGGAAGCDPFATAPYAIGGISANGLGSTPYNVSTGGTDFLDTAEGTNNLYWNTTNGPTGKSAKSYIPETPWNDSCASSVLYLLAGYPNGLAFCNSATGSSFLDIVAGSGAPSIVYPKPYWQNGVAGVPNDGHRDLPDISLFTSDGFWLHAVLLCMSDSAQGGSPCDYTNATDTFNNSRGGTSFSAPQYASIQALINQKAGGPQGNPAPIYYDLAKFEYGTSYYPNTQNLQECNSNLGYDVASWCVFHDVTTGNNNVPCYGTNNCYDPSPADYGLLSTSDNYLSKAYGTHPGWDFATGLGSVNVTNLVSMWP